ncbi:MAG: hydantoinase/oxoprolinase N-terminal domain-containing protein, partial [Candidatus Polarisedimenticolia bacterium]
MDTGGTFTDAVGIDLSGGVHRAKILSSAALRGTVVRALSRDRLEIGPGADLPEGFLEGFTFRLLGQSRGPNERTVRRHGPGSGTIEIAPPFSAPPSPGTAFEAGSDEEAPILAARLLTRTPLRAPLPPIALRLATTLGTNALLERRGAPAALFITRGFGDLLEIGTQQRPELFALDIRRPRPLHAAVVEVRERLTADGSVLRPLDESALVDEAATLVNRGLRVAAVALLHADRNPRHEERVEAILRAAGFEQVSRSSDLSPFVRLLPRATTAVADAYLSPIVRGYLQRVRA